MYIGTVSHMESTDVNKTGVQRKHIYKGKLFCHLKSSLLITIRKLEISEV